MGKNKKNSGESGEGSGQTKKRVMTHRGKGQESGIPDDIKPKKASDEIIENPVDPCVNPAKQLKDAPVQSSPSKESHEPSSRPLSPSSKQPSRSSGTANLGAPSQPNGHKVSKGQWLVGFACLLSFGALVIVGISSFYLYQTQNELNILKSAVVSDHQAMGILVDKAEEALKQVTQLQNENENSQQVLTDLRKDVEEAQIKFITLTGKKDWVLNEVKFLVQSAHNQLAINQDLRTARSLLVASEQKVKDLSLPTLSSLRNSLNQDIAQIQSTTEVDKEGIWSKLNALSSQFKDLTFKTLVESPQDEESIKDQPNSQEQKEWQKALNKSWDEIKGLVRVSRYDQDVMQPVLAQHEQNQLLRVMQFSIEQAKWAVLRQDTLVYEESLKQLEQNIIHYFESNAVQENLKNLISELKGTEILTSMPDLSLTLSEIDKSLLQATSSQNLEILQ